MAKLSHGLEIPISPVIEMAEVDAILLEYECAYIDANGADPLLHKISDDVYAIDDAGIEGIHVFEFPYLTRTLWERVAHRNNEACIGPIVALFKRLVTVNIREVIANEFQTSERG